MEYASIANARVRAEAQRCLRAYHEAYRLRQATHPTRTAAATASASASPACQGACWRFYRGELPASPGTELVDDLLAYGGESSRGRVLSTWSPSELEHRHDYIQWLFPLRERGVNAFAPLLSTAEAATMAQDGLVMARVLQAFRVMLRFYGTEVTYAHDEACAGLRRSSATKPAEKLYLTAQLCRTRDHTEWAAQYDNLIRHSHNYLRISRILQFLGEVGLEPLKLGWLEFLAQEVVDSRVASTASTSTSPSPPPPLTACRGSFFFWMETPYEREDRIRLQELVVKLATQPAAAAAATTAMSAESSRPVVTVKGLLLPSTLDLSRVVSTGAQRSAEVASLPVCEKMRQKSSKRRRE